MNIDRLNQNLASGAYGRRAGRAGESSAARDADAPKRAEGAARSDAGDAVQVSDQARFVQRASRAVNNAPDVRETVVADLRERIQTGAYQVDDVAIARRLVAQE